MAPHITYLGVFFTELEKFDSQLQLFCEFTRLVAHGVVVWSSRCRGISLGQLLSTRDNSTWNRSIQIQGGHHR